MTTQTTQHTFSAPIEVIGKPFRGGDGWDIVVGWKLPGSQYNQHISGKEWNDISHFQVGQIHNWVLNRGSLKEGKSGQYQTDYFWNWDQQAAPSTGDVDELFTGKPEPDRGHAEKPNAGITVEGVVQGHLEKLAVDLLLGEQNQGHIAIGAPIEMWQIREKRDLLFHELKQIPIQEPYWCHEHNSRRKQSPAGTYVHPHKDGDQAVFCTPDGLVDGTGAPANTESEHTDDLPF